jgi:hypothetical protein
MRSRDAWALSIGHLGMGMLVLQQGIAQLLARMLPDNIWQAPGEGIWLIAKTLKIVIERTNRIPFFILNSV